MGWLLRHLLWLLVILPAWLMWEVLRAPEQPPHRTGGKPWET